MTTDSDSDRVEAPVTNEELYAKLQRTQYMLGLLAALVFAALAYPAMATGTDTGTAAAGILMLASLFTFAVFKGLKDRSWLSVLTKSVSSWDGEETLEEEKERLTGAARTDGGDNDA